VQSRRLLTRKASSWPPRSGFVRTDRFPCYSSEAKQLSFVRSLCPVLWLQGLQERDEIILVLVRQVQIETGVVEIDCISSVAAEPLWK